MKKRILIFLILLSFAFSVSAHKKEARQIDEFEQITCDDIISRIDNLNSYLRNEPDSIAFIFVYEGKYFDFSAGKENYVLPKFGESIARTRTMQERLKFSSYDPEKICIY